MSNGHEPLRPQAGDVFRLDLGDGHVIDIEYDPAVANAAKRMSDAIAAGNQPDPADLRLLAAWLNFQEAKFGNIM